MTQAHRGPGLYWKEGSIRDRPLFRFEEHGLPVELIKTRFCVYRGSRARLLTGPSYRSDGLDSIEHQRNPLNRNDVYVFGAGLVACACSQRVAVAVQAGAQFHTMKMKTLHFLNYKYSLYIFWFFYIGGLYLYRGPIFSSAYWLRAPVHVHNWHKP